MTARLIVLAVSVAAVLALVWFRNCRTGRPEAQFQTSRVAG